MTPTKDNFVITENGDIILPILNCKTDGLRKIKAEHIINEILQNQEKAKKHITLEGYRFGCIVCGICGIAIGLITGIFIIGKVIYGG